MKGEQKERVARGEELTRLRRRVAELESHIDGSVLPDAEGKQPVWYDQLFLSNPHPMCIYDLETLRFLDVNNAAVHHYGYSRDEFLSMTLKDIRPPEDVPAMLANVAAVTEGLDVAGRWRHLRKNGSLIYVEILSHTLNCRGRRAELVLMRDVTDQVKMEEVLRRREGFFSNVLDSIQDGISILDQDLRIMRVNRTMEQWYRHRMPLVGKKCYEAYHGRADACEPCPTQRTLQDGAHHVEIVPYSGPEDRRGWLELHSFPLRGAPDAEMEGVIEYVRDVTEKWAAEEGLRSEKNKLEGILAAIGDGISIQDRDFRVLYQNEIHQGMIGDHVGEYCYRAYESQDAVCEGCPVARCFEDGKIHAAEREIAGEGGTRHFEITTSPVRDGKGEIMAGIEVVREITERKGMEEQMLRVQKLESLGILAGGIAHDFNNLLTGVLGNISVARKHLEADGFASERLVRAEKASLRAKDLTHQLLTFARGGAPQKKIVASRELIRESVQLGLRGSNVNCRLSLAEELWPMEADPGQISQVIHNLVINAEQAMPKGGVIAVTGDNVTLPAGNDGGLKQGKYIRLRIQDQGAGIPEEHIARIFDPFFTTKEAGGGLGLSISYSVVSRHNGLLTVTSEEGRGTECTIWLPATEKKVDRAEAPSEKDVAARRRRILVMDDERVIRDVATHILQREGYEVSCASDGREAIRSYREGQASGEPFDCVILDLTIPGGMGGKEAIGKLREIDPAVKAVVSSGYSNDPVLADFAEAGFSGAVQKPYTAEEMLDAVARVLAEGSG